MKKELIVFQNENLDQKRKLKSLNQKVKRCETKLTSLKTLFNKKLLCDEETVSKLKVKRKY